MSKDVVINGTTYEGVSTVALALAAGGTALFVDSDEASGGSIDGIVAIATGTFSVASAVDQYTVAHGLPVAPDLAAVFPVHWHDTTTANLGLSAKTNFARVLVGRRDIAASPPTPYQTGSISTDMLSGEEIVFAASTLAKFQPTYTDAEGNTGPQVYRWVAIKFKEVG